MGDSTEISWADSTVSFWIGCTRVSDGCTNCYAAEYGRRFGIVWDAPPILTGDASWRKIALYQRTAARFYAQYGRQRRVFINSLSDFFDNQAERDWQREAAIEMENAPDVVFILVTKRPQNVARLAPGHWLKPDGWPANVWLLVTAENQEEYDRRVAHLLALTGPSVVGISMEPMLEQIVPGHSISYSARERSAWASKILRRPVATANTLSWVIIGGESGKGARLMPPLDRVIRLASEFTAAGTAVFVKQMSAASAPTTYKDVTTFPKSLQMRKFPA